MTQRQLQDLKPNRDVKASSIFCTLRRTDARRKIKSQLDVWRLLLVSSGNFNRKYLIFLVPLLYQTPGVTSHMKEFDTGT